jgi:hypothetical protein
VREFAQSERAKAQKIDAIPSVSEISNEKDAQKGMDEMSEKFKELGSEIYVKNVVNQ